MSEAWTKSYATLSRANSSGITHVSSPTLSSSQLYPELRSESDIPANLPLISELDLSLSEEEIRTLDPHTDVDIHGLKDTLTNLQQMYNTLFGSSEQVLPTVDSTACSIESPEKNESVVVESDNLSTTAEGNTSGMLLSVERALVERKEPNFLRTESRFIPPWPTDMNSLAKIPPTVSSPDTSKHPWVIVRRYGKRGGKKYAYPIQSKSYFVSLVQNLVFGPFVFEKQPQKLKSKIFPL